MSTIPYIGGVVVCGLSYSIGANDAANALGTAVGSAAMTLKQAIILGAVFETLGTLLMGGFVSSTLKTHIVDPEAVDAAVYFALGMLSALISSTILLIIATVMALPVSTTQTVTGGIIGFGIGAANRGASVDMQTVINIGLSWVATPFISLIFAFILYYVIYKTMIQQAQAEDMSRKRVPMLTAFTFCLLSAFIYISVTKSFPSISLVWLPLVMLVCGTLSFLVSKYVRLNYDRTGSSFVPGFFIDLPCMKQTPVDNTHRSRKHSGTHNHKPSHLSDNLKMPRIPFDDMGESSQHEPDDSAEMVELGKVTHNHKNGVIVAPHDVDFSDRDVVSVDIQPVGDDKDNPVKLVIRICEADLNVLSGSTGDSRESEETKEAEEEPDSHPVTMIRTHRSFVMNRAQYRFRPLMIVAAAAVAFAHGANDVANAVGPFTAIVEYGRDKEIDPDSSLLDLKNIWILLLGALFIVVGLVTYGHKVITTVGTEICHLTMSKAFASQLSAAVTVMIATVLGMPVSTTSALIGAITGVGLVDYRHKVLYHIGALTHSSTNVGLSKENQKNTLNAKLLGKIVLGWIVSLVAAAVVSYIIYEIEVAIWMAG